MSLAELAVERNLVAVTGALDVRSYRDEEFGDEPLEGSARDR